MVKSNEDILQDTSQQIVDDLEELILALAGGKKDSTYGPAIMQVSTYSQGKGQAMLNGNAVTIKAHPAQIVNSGDVVVGVPLRPTLYYVVGKL